jgi:PAS domain-containing protein
MGQPLLVNNRARHLLGQREEPAAGIAHWPRVYRIHRPDGTPYPWEELPVYKALHLGLTTMRDDLVIHRPDGRQIPLVTWAAPIYLGPAGRIEAAVWVFEDLTSLEQAEVGRIDADARLRTVVHNMPEGLMIQDQNRVILECNPAACALLGTSQDELLGRNHLFAPSSCRREDGSPLPEDEAPDLVSLGTLQPVRNLILGLTIPSTDPAATPTVRWLLVNSTPFTSGRIGKPGFLLQVVTTITDITAGRPPTSG